MLNILTFFFSPPIFTNVPTPLHHPAIMTKTKRVLTDSEVTWYWRRHKYTDCKSDTQQLN